MASPWLKFFPSNWRSDPALRMCSLGARGLWAEMICLMHEAEPYGHLLVNGIPVNEKQLASLAGCPLRETVNYLAELESCGVFSRRGDGIIYSRRMKRDHEKAERDKANGKLGGNPEIVGGVNPKEKGEDKAQKLEATFQNPEPERLGSFRSVGSEGVKRKAPPHGATGKGRIWISAASDDWKAYAEDFRVAHGEYPKPDDRGGKWFKVSGESSSRVA